MSFSREMKAGLIAAVAILAFGYAMSYVTSVRRQKEWGTPYHIIFSRVEGIEEGTTVWYSGRYVGRVRRLSIRPGDQRVDVTIAILPFSNVELTQQSHYRIAGRLFGTHWLTIQHESGDPVPPDGAVVGESIPPFSDVMSHFVETLDLGQRMLTDFRVRYGRPEVLRRQTLAEIKGLNEMSFDIRARVNNFNKLTDVALQQLDKMASRLQQRVALARVKATQVTTQVRLYSMALLDTDKKGEAQLRQTLSGLGASVARMGTYVAQMRALTTQQQQLASKLADMHKKAQEYHDMAQLLHLMTHNPETARDLKGNLERMRAGVHQVRETMDRLSGRTTPSLPAPHPSASPSPDTAPSSSPTRSSSSGATPRSSPTHRPAPAPTPTAVLSPTGSEAASPAPAATESQASPAPSGAPGPGR